MVSSNKKSSDYNKLDPLRQAMNEIAKKVSEFMLEDKDPHYKNLIENAQKVGEILAKQKITSSQIRNLYNEVKNIDFLENGPRKINLMKAKFAYVAGRFEKLQDFKNIVENMLNEIGTDKAKFDRFKYFFEAVVAYHRAYGGKE